jgi:uncharacterized membrane protein
VASGDEAGLRARATAGMRRRASAALHAPGRLLRRVGADVDTTWLTLPVLLLVFAIANYIAVFGVLTWQQQQFYGTFGFDMGIFDQGIWLLSRFKDPFVTIRGLEYFGNHVNVTTVLLVPFYWLGAGPLFLSELQTVALALGAVPVWLIARDRLQSAWSALAIAVAYLLYPSIEWVNWWHFHPDALAVTPLLFAYWFAGRGRWRAYAVALVFVLFAKEDAAMVVVVLGLLVAVRWNRRVGLATVVAGAAWFGLCLWVILPFATGWRGPFYQQLFPMFGSSVGEIAWNLVRHPGRWAHLLTDPARSLYLRQLFLPVALLPFASFAGLATLLIGAPALLINLASSQASTYDIHFQYAALIDAAVFLAVIETIGRYGNGTRRLDRRYLVALLLVCTAFAHWQWSPSPLSVQFDRGFWIRAQPRQATFDAAVAAVPAYAGISATYNLVPHLAHRVHVYEWPNPWVISYWGVEGENRPDPKNVQYLVLDLMVVGPEHQAIVDRLLAPGGEFERVFEHDQILVARRRAEATSLNHLALPALAAAAGVDVTDHQRGSPPS